MRTSFVIVVVAVAIGCAAARSSEFDAFIRSHNKQYDTAYEYDKRQAIFTENLKVIASFNEQGGNDSAIYGITAFADRTREEYKQSLSNGLLPPPDNMYGGHYRALDFSVHQNPPVSVDWRTQGAVTPIKNQANCGSCWAFSTIANIEGQWFLAGHNLTSLSEEQLLDCDPTNCGCNGGYPSVAFEHIISAGGLMSEASYSYCVPPFGDCYPCQLNKNKTQCGPKPNYCNTTCHFRSSNVAAKISSWTQLSRNETEIAAYLATHGPLSVLMNAEWLQFYHSGISNPAFCDPAGLDHAVLLVGYGREDDKDFWIVKNSWGPKWGEKGFFRIIRGEGRCGINTYATTALV